MSEHDVTARLLTDSANGPGSSKPPAGTIAAQESPHGDRYYELRIGAW